MQNFWRNTNKKTNKKNNRKQTKTNENKRKQTKTNENERKRTKTNENEISQKIGCHASNHMSIKSTYEITSIWTCFNRKAKQKKLDSISILLSISFLRRHFNIFTFYKKRHKKHAMKQNKIKQIKTVTIVCVCFKNKNVKTHTQKKNKMS